MKTLIALMLLCIVPLVAAAEEPTASPATSARDLMNPLPDQGVALLELSPMFLEIKSIFEQTDELESVLLQQLAAAKTDDEAQFIVDRLRQVDLDRTLAVLKVQARHARLDNRFELERQLKAEMVAVLQQNMR